MTHEVLKIVVARRRCASAGLNGPLFTYYPVYLDAVTAVYSRHVVVESIFVQMCHQPERVVRSW
jgi:hypothetical protein